MVNHRHAYLIMAHNQWELLFELLKAIDDPRNDIYLHIDKKVCAPDLDQLAKNVRQSKLILTRRYNIVWGGTQMMKSALSMLEQAAAVGYSRYHLISGTDFPIKSQNHIHNFFSRNPDLQFVGFDWNGIKSGSFLSRVQYYHFLINIIGKRTNCSVLYRLLEKAEDLSLTVQSKLRVNRISYSMYKGSSWFRPF